MASEDQLSRSEDLVLKVVEAIAEHRGVDTDDLDRPVGEVVDPEALARLFSAPDGEGYVAFRYGDCGVVVHANGEVDVYDAVELPALFR